MDDTGLNIKQRTIKRCFDLLLATFGLLLTFWLIFLAWVAASLETRSNGFFTQQRVGKGGSLFNIVKIRTMRAGHQFGTTVTQAGDPRITPLGRLFRRTKIDELPQLWNVLLGDMSFVGPRPDVPGNADKLDGPQRLLLTVRPGITGPATIRYRDEENILAMQDDPEAYNRDVIYPDKVRINIAYIQNWKFTCDLQCIWRTVFR